MVIDDEVGQQFEIAPARAARPRCQNDRTRGRCGRKRSRDQFGALQNAALQRHLRQQRRAEAALDHLNQRVQAGRLDARLGIWRLLSACGDRVIAQAMAFFEEQNLTQVQLLHRHCFFLGVRIVFARDEPELIVE